MELKDFIRNNSRLLVGGNFTDEELKELSNELGLEVKKYHKKSFTDPHFIQIVFQNFDLVSLLRDAVIIETIKFIFSKWKDWLTPKKQNTSSKMAIVLTSKDGNLPSVNIGIPEDNMQVFLEKLDKTLNMEFIKNAGDKKIISITWDSEADDLKTIIF